MYINKDYEEKDKSYFHHQRAEMIKYVPESSKMILEIGCSSGWFGRLLKQKISCEVWGVEPDKESALIAKKNIDRVFNVLFDENLDLENVKFDCIILNDVLEHLINPEITIRLCKKHLKDQGVIISSIPNIRFNKVMTQIILKKDWIYEESGVLDKTHLRFFTSKSILRLFENEGYKVIKHEGINPSFTRIFKVLNILCLNAIEDMKYPQFATVVKLK
jgi:2-polyprenyl-3-methyl-5-hydroxy-6-metoxy-1,4-benzoquinol methylase